VPGRGARPVPFPAPRGRPRGRLVVDARVQRGAPPRFPRRSHARRGPPAIRGKFYFCVVCLTGKLTDTDETRRIRAYMAQERALGEPRFQAMVEKALNRSAAVRRRGQCGQRKWRERWINYLRPLCSFVRCLYLPLLVLRGREVN